MKNLRVSSKLILSFLIIAVLATAIGVMGITGMVRIEQSGAYMYENVASPLPYLARVQETLQNMRVYVREMVIASMSGDMDGVEESFSVIESLIPVMAENLDAYDAALDSGTGAKMLFDEARSLYENELTQTVLAIHNASQSTNVPEILQNMETCRILSDKILSNFDACLDLKVGEAEEASRNAIILSQSLLVMIIVILLIALAAAVFLTFYISGLIGKPLAMISKALNQLGTKGDLEFSPEIMKSTMECSSWRDEIGACARGFGGLVQHLTNTEKNLSLISGGDLTVAVETLSERDNIGLSVKKMVENLNNMFGEIQRATSQVSSGANQIAGGSQSLAQGATEQAATVQQLSSSIAEIAQKTKDNADMAARSAELADTIKGSAEKGSRQMDEMITAVNEINQASQNIGKVIKAIDDIAFQTNILALNAAVEAARAGQHGKGFAVVADEVRNLAAKSAEAAKDTSSLIASSIEKAKLGTRIADDTAASLAEIVSGINESSQIASTIAESSKEQFAGISNINDGIEQVSQVVHQNSATSEESAAASQELSGQSEMLEGLIAQFELKNGNAEKQGRQETLSTAMAL